MSTVFCEVAYSAAAVHEKMQRKGQRTIKTSVRRREVKVPAEAAGSEAALSRWGQKRAERQGKAHQHDGGGSRYARDGAQRRRRSGRQSGKPRKDEIRAYLKI